MSYAISRPGYQVGDFWKMIGRPLTWGQGQPQQVSPWTSFTGSGGQRQGGLTEASRLMFDQDPAAGYEAWLQTFSPAFADEQALRRIYSQLTTRYNAEVAKGGAGTADMRWIDWLSGIDPNTELSRLSQELRGTQGLAARFGRPVRQISF